MIILTLTALTLFPANDPEPTDATATKIIARGRWLHARADVNAGGKDRVQLVIRNAGELNKAVPYLWLERAHWTIAANPKVNGFLPAKNGSIQTLGAKTWVADLWLSR